MSLVDLDGDQALDLIAPDYIANVVSVILGKGDGTFGAKAGYATGTGPSGSIVEDLNGDGKLDVVTWCCNKIYQ